MAMGWIKREGDVYTVYINGIQVIQSTTAGTSLGAKTLYIGQFLRQKWHYR